MLILGLDFETTGLNPQTDRVIEVGAVLWDWEKQAPMKVLSSLVKPFNVLTLPPEITEITGITFDQLENFGAEPTTIFSDLFNLLRECDYAMAHNAPFDRGFLERELCLTSYGVPEVPWIDSAVDVPYTTKGSRSLNYLAADHGFVNPFAHRAVFDVLTMLKIVGRYDIEKIIELAKEPTILIRAMVDYYTKDKAKPFGYRWQADQKVWVKGIKAFQLEEETAKAEKAGFSIRRIDEDKKESD